MDDSNVPEKGTLQSFSMKEKVLEAYQALIDIEKWYLDHSQYLFLEKIQFVKPGFPPTKGTSLFTAPMQLPLT